jgi:IS5 family transposase
MPWFELLALVAPHYAKGETGRKPVRVVGSRGGRRSVRIAGAAVLRRFAGIDLGRAPTSDETTILNFRHLLEEHELCGEILDTVNLYLESMGIRITTGTIVDATIIHAPSSTKNEKKERDPEMHQTKKGNQWLFGMKAHIGVDSKEGVVHSVCSTSASVSDVHMLPELVHGDERKIWSDAGYQGQTKQSARSRPSAGYDVAARENKSGHGRGRET